jgi:hypothetical protein
MNLLNHEQLWQRITDGLIRMQYLLAFQHYQVVYYQTIGTPPNLPLNPKRLPC